MAKDWRRPAEAARRHWKQREAGQTSTAARGVKRLVFTLLSVVLVGVLIWYIYPRRQAVYFAYLAEDYGPTLRDAAKVEAATLAPPVATSAGVYSREFAPLGKRLFPKQFHLANVASAGDSKLAAQKLVETLTAPLKDKWNLDQVEFLVLYVNAHGLAIDGEPYLMWNEDYAAELARRIDGQSQPGLMKLDDLLAQVKQLDAAQKLLVLDCGQFVADPRLGLFVNEFPRLAEDRVASVGDESLWVLTSHSAMEQAYVFDADRTSVFGHFVSRGVAGASRSREDEDLSLRAFVEYVVGEVGKTVASRIGEVQTPRIVNGQRGVLSPSDVPNTTFLKHNFFDHSVTVAGANRREMPSSTKVGASWPAAVAVMAMAQTPAASGDAPDAAAVTPKQPPAAAGTPAAPPAGGATPATTPAVPATNPPATIPPAATPAATTAPPAASGAAAPPPGGSGDKKGPPATVDFAEVWNRVDKIEDPIENPDAWSPVDYAPHLWAQLRRQLVWYAARYEIESDQRAENSAFIAAQILAPLDGVLLRDGVVESTPSSSNDLFGELQRARDAFRNGAAYSSAADTSHDGVRNFRVAVRLKNYLTHRVAEQVRHYGYAPDPQAARYDAIVAVIEPLRRLTARLETESETSLTDDWTNELGLLKELRQLRADFQRIPDVQRTLHSIGGVPAEAPSRGVAKSKPPHITGEQPALWVDLYARIATLAARDSSTVASDGAALISAAGGDSADLAEHFDQLQRIAEGRAPRSDEQVYWQAYRAVGLQIRRFSESLDAGLRQRVDADYDNSALGKLERRLRLVDGRDAPNVARDINVVARRQLCPPIAHRVQIELAEAKVSLPPPSSGDGGLTRVVPKYVWRGKTPATATVTVTLKNEAAARNILEVDSPPLNTPIEIPLSAAGSLPEVVLRQSGERKNATNIETATLQIVVQVVGEESSPPTVAELNVEAHGSELVKLAAYRVRGGDDVGIDNPGDDEPTREIGDSKLGGGAIKARMFHVILRPFPNRADQYRFKITNVSGATTTRNVTVDLHAALEPIDPDNAAALFDERGEPVAAKFQALSRFTRPLNLSANEPQVFPFVEPAQPAAEDAAKPAAAAAPAAEAKKEEAPPEPIADFRHGMLFHVRDNDNPQLHWYHWVEFRAREPARYVEPKVTYDSRLGRLEILITPLAGATPPPDGFSARWSAGDVAVDAGTMVVDKKRKDEIRLGVSGWRPPAPQRGEPLIPLFVTVDDFPRAFVYLFTPATPPPTPERPLEALRVETNFRRVKIVEPPADLFPYKKDEPGEIPVMIGIEVDGQTSDKTFVGLNDGNNETQDFTAKRAVHVLMFEKGWDDENALSLTSTVGDFVGADAIRFDTSLVETLIPVTAELKDGNATLKRDSLSIVVDEQPPRLLALSDPVVDPPSTEKELDVTVTPTVSDRGGVSRIEFFFLAEGKNPPTDEQQAKPDFFWPPPPPPGESVPPIVNDTAVPITFRFDRGPGRWSIWAVAVNQVGRRSAPMRTPNPLVVEEPKEKTMPKTGGVTITGMTIRNDEPLPNITVELIPLEKGKGSPQSTKSVDPTPMDFLNDAVYRFENVAPGTYKIVAQGNAKGSGGRAVAGEVPKIVIGEDDTGTKSFDIKLLNK